MKRYNWQQPDWPNFRYDESVVQETLFIIAEKNGLLSGKITHLNEELQTETLIDLMVEEAVKTSEIEGEKINRQDVRSSIKNKLGLNEKIIRISDKRAQGTADLLLSARKTFKKPLRETQLFNWHLMLFSGTTNSNLKVGYWRIDEEPMQIVSGHHNKWTVHFEAPPAKAVPKEMETFINWFNNTAPGKPQAIKSPPIRAAIAHLYFESIHPFEDGNGRIGRAIAEKALSQGLGHPAMLSLSQAIEAEKKSYYEALKTASRSNDITAWIRYFVNIVLKAQEHTEAEINFILKKSLFFAKFKDVLNERQTKMIKRMLREGKEGFEGGMSAKKYMAITSTSKATATRDLQNLLEIGVLRQTGSGRNVRYELVLM